MSLCKKEERSNCVCVCRDWAVGVLIVHVKKFVAVCVERVDCLEECCGCMCL